MMGIMQLAPAFVWLLPLLLLLDACFVGNCCGYAAAVVVVASAEIEILQLWMKDEFSLSLSLSLSLSACVWCV